MEENISTIIRVKPYQKTRDWESRISIDNINHTVIDTDSSKVYHFDHILDENASDNQVYSCVRSSLVSHVLKGYESAILCYGQTGSGKTYTCFNRRGGSILSKSAKDIFGHVNAEMDISNNSNRDGHSAKQQQLQYLVMVSVIEIYNEQVYDLLMKTDTPPFHSTKPLEVRQQKNGDWAIYNQTLHACKTPEELTELVFESQKIRHSYSTRKNRQSSRSHCICSIILEKVQSNFYTHSMKNEGLIHHIPASSTTSASTSSSAYSSVSSSSNKGGTHDGSTGFSSNTKGILHIVDLAGSGERLDGVYTHYSRGQKQESSSINKSLSTLNNVIQMMGQVQRKKKLQFVSPHSQSSNAKKSSTVIPFRDSKLTRILKNSLTGNGRALFIGCVDIESSNHTETIHTLKFLDRVRKIKQKPMKITAKNNNTHLHSHGDPRQKYQTMLEMMKSEIKQLQLKLTNTHYVHKKLLDMVNSEIPAIVTQMGSPKVLRNGVDLQVGSPGKKLSPDKKEESNVHHGGRSESNELSGDAEREENLRRLRQLQNSILSSANRKHQLEIDKHLSNNHNNSMQTDSERVEDSEMNSSDDVDSQDDDSILNITDHQTQQEQKHQNQNQRPFLQIRSDGKTAVPVKPHAGGSSSSTAVTAASILNTLRVSVPAAKSNPSAAESSHSPSKNNRDESLKEFSSPKRTLLVRNDRGMNNENLIQSPQPQHYQTTNRVIDVMSSPRSMKFIHTMTSKISSLRDCYSQQMKFNWDLQQELESLKNHNETLNITLDELKQENTTKNIEMNDLNNELNKYKIQTDISNNTINEQKIKINNLMIKNNDIRNELINKKQNEQLLFNDNKQQISLLENKIQELRNNQKIFNHEKQKLLNINENYLNKLNIKENLLNENKKKIYELNEKLNLVKESFNEYNLLKTQHLKIKHNYVNLEEKYNEIKKELNEYKNTMIPELNQEKQQMIDQLNNVKGNKNQMVNNNNKLKKIIDNQKIKIIKLEEQFETETIKNKQLNLKLKLYQSRLNKISNHKNHLMYHDLKNIRLLFNNLKRYVKNEVSKMNSNNRYISTTVTELISNAELAYKEQNQMIKEQTQAKMRAGRIITQMTSVEDQKKNKQHSNNNNNPLSEGKLFVRKSIDSNNYSSSNSTPLTMSSSSNNSHPSREESYGQQSRILSVSNPTNVAIQSSKQSQNQNNHNDVFDFPSSMDSISSSSGSKNEKRQKNTEQSEQEKLLREEQKKYQHLLNSYNQIQELVNEMEEKQKEMDSKRSKIPSSKRKNATDKVYHRKGTTNISKKEEIEQIIAENEDSAEDPRARELDEDVRKLSERVQFYVKQTKLYDKRIEESPEKGAGLSQSERESQLNSSQRSSLSMPSDMLSNHSHHMSHQQQSEKISYGRDDHSDIFLRLD